MFPYKNVTYQRLFDLNKKHVKQSPTNVTHDFEKAAMNELVKLFNTKIDGCYFHFSQNLFKYLDKLKLRTEYNSRTAFNLLADLEFLPISEVIKGFAYVSFISPVYFV